MEWAYRYEVTPNDNRTGAPAPPLVRNNFERLDQACVTGSP